MAATSPSAAFLFDNLDRCCTTYHQAVRMGDWKALRHGRGGRIELYDLSENLAETHDVAAQHPEIVNKIEQLMRTAVTPSRRYEVGKLYEGGPIWQLSMP